MMKYNIRLLEKDNDMKIRLAKETDYKELALMKWEHGAEDDIDLESIILTELIKKPLSKNLFLSFVLIENMKSLLPKITVLLFQQCLFI